MKHVKIICDIETTYLLFVKFIVRLIIYEIAHLIVRLIICGIKN
jgi:hypothetical protein